MATFFEQISIRSILATLITLFLYEKIKAYYRRLVPQINEPELDALEACLFIRQFPKGNFLVEAGQVCKYVSFLNKGLARLYYTVDGKDISIGFVGEGEYTSEYESFLTRKPAMQNIEALTDVESVDLGIDDMQMLYKQYPVFRNLEER